MTVCLLFLSGCGGVNEQQPPPPPVLQSIAISPPSPSIAPGTTLQMRADGLYSNNASSNVTSLATWTSSNTAIATVDAEGLVSAVLSTTGTATVSASYAGLTGSTVLTSSDLASIAVTPANQVIAKGTTIQYAATGTLANTATQNISSFVTWTAAPSATASISDSGLATAGSTTGIATISATFSAITGSTQLTSADVASIAVAPSSASIALGTTQQYTATATLVSGGSHTQDLTSRATWSSSSPSVATINTTGLAASHATGTTFISAAYSLVTSNTATLDVTPAVLTSLTVTPVNPSVVLGKTLQFTATGTFSNGLTQNLTSLVSWSSSKTTVATISNATGSNGLAKSVAVGTTTITATSGSFSSATTLTVTPVVLESILVTPVSFSISIADSNTKQYTATGIFSDGSFQDLTTSVTWASSNINIPISNTSGSQGLATNTFFSPGSTNITATFSGITSNTATLTFF